IKLVLEQLRLVTDQNKKSKRSLTGKNLWGIYPTPDPEQPEPISNDKLQIALSSNLSKWEKVVSPLPEDPTKVRVEIFRQYNFKTFRHAIEFMNQVAPGCDIALHHPRWENVWQTVRVYLTTWDIGHQISDRDIQLAKYFDKAFSDFPGAKLDS
ncbi:MAG: 4a-hydroxytetrahydrobiopterin dehydratase, partial [Nostoc sp.]